MPYIGYLHCVWMGKFHMLIHVCYHGGSTGEGCKCWFLYFQRCCGYIMTRSIPFGKGIPELVTCVFGCHGGMEWKHIPQRMADCAHVPPGRITWFLTSGFIVWVITVTGITLWILGMLFVRGSVRVGTHHPVCKAENGRQDKSGNGCDVWQQLSDN